MSELATSINVSVEDSAEILSEWRESKVRELRESTGERRDDV